jgi:hypothetical protein
MCRSEDPVLPNVWLEMVDLDGHRSSSVVVDFTELGQLVEPEDSALRRDESRVAGKGQSLGLELGGPRRPPQCIGREVAVAASTANSPPRPP